MGSKPSITLLCADGINTDKANDLLAQQAAIFPVQDIILVSNRAPAQKHPGFTYYAGGLNSKDDYSRAILNLGQIVKTDFVLVVQLDGHIINPDLWTDEFFEYDYLGAPWPDDDLWVSKMWPVTRTIYESNKRQSRIGNGGFSLRSAKFLRFSMQFPDTEGFGEDVYLCIHQYQTALQQGIHFPSVDLALRFSKENPLRELNCQWPDTSPEFDNWRSFGSHHYYRHSIL
jgi:hypothetical protein